MKKTKKIEIEKKNQVLERLMVNMSMKLAADTIKELLSLWFL